MGIIKRLLSRFFAEPRATRLDEPYVTARISTLRSNLYSPQWLKEAGLPEALEDTVQGVVVEIGIQGTVVILAGFADGTSRIFIGSGGGLIGLKEGFPPETRIAAQKLVAVGQSAVGNALPEAARDWPQEGHVRFALLSKGGVRTLKAATASIPDSGPPLVTLREATNELLAPLLRFARERGIVTPSGADPSALWSSFA